MGRARDGGASSVTGRIAWYLGGQAVPAASRRAHRQLGEPRNFRRARDVGARPLPAADQDRGRALVRSLAAAGLLHGGRGLLRGFFLLLAVDAVANALDRVAEI